MGPLPMRPHVQLGPFAEACQLLRPPGLGDALLRHSLSPHIRHNRAQTPELVRGMCSTLCLGGLAAGLLDFGKFWKNTAPPPRGGRAAGAGQPSGAEGAKTLHFGVF